MAGLTDSIPGIGVGAEGSVETFEIGVTGSGGSLAGTGVESLGNPERAEIGLAVLASAVAGRLAVLRRGDEATVGCCTSVFSRSTVGSEGGRAESSVRMLETI